METTNHGASQDPEQATLLDHLIRFVSNSGISIAELYSAAQTLLTSREAVDWTTTPAARRHEVGVNDNGPVYLRMTRGPQQALLLDDVIVFMSNSGISIVELNGAVQTLLIPMDVDGSAATPLLRRGEDANAGAMDGAETEEELEEGEVSGHSVDISTRLPADPKWTPPGLRKAPDSCHICLEKLGDDSLITPCCHVYCRPCIVEWYRTAVAERRTVQCPDCRQELLPISATRPLWNTSLAGAAEPDDGVDRNEDYGSNGHVDELIGEVRNWDTVQDIIQRSGILRDSFAREHGIMPTQLRLEVSHAVHYLLNPGPANIPTAPSLLDAPSAIVDVLVFEALLAAAYETQAPELLCDGPSLSSLGLASRGFNPDGTEYNLRMCWRDVVGMFLSILPDYNGGRLSASALQEILEEGLYMTCAPYGEGNIDPFMNDSGSSDSKFGNMVVELIQYVVSRAVQRRLERIFRGPPNTS